MNTKAGFNTPSTLPPKPPKPVFKNLRCLVPVLATDRGNGRPYTVIKADKEFILISADGRLTWTGNATYLDEHYEVAPGNQGFVAGIEVPAA